MEPYICCIHLAVESGNIDNVRRFLEDTSRIDSFDEHGFTPLHIAARLGYEDIVLILIQKKANVYAVDHAESLQPIHFAVRSGNLRIIEYLLIEGEDPYGELKFLIDLLEFAAQERQERAVSFIIEVTRLTRYRHVAHCNTALHGACYFGCINAVKALLAHGCLVNALNIEDWTPMDFAASRGHKSIVDYLFKTYFSDLEGAIQVLHTAVRYAIKGGFTDIVIYYLEQGFDINYQGTAQYTLLHCACSVGSLHLVNYLLQNGADFGKLTSTGYSPFHLACLNHESCDILELLIQKGADFESSVADGPTPLDLVFTQRCVKLIEPEARKIVACARIIIKYTVFVHKIKNPELNVPHFRPILMDYWEQYYKQIVKMDSCMIENTNVSLYRFLRDSYDVNKLIMYLNNPELRREVIYLQRYIRKYHLYANIIRPVRENLRKGFDLLRSLEGADNTLVFVAPCLPSECRYHILQYLRVDDLNRFRC